MLYYVVMHGMMWYVLYGGVVHDMALYVYKQYCIVWCCMNLSGDVLYCILGVLQHVKLCMLWLHDMYVLYCTVMYVSV